VKLGFGRILDAPSSASGTTDAPTRRNAPVAGGERLARVIPPALVTAHDETRTLLARAEQQATTILAEARAEAVGLRARAAEEGHADAAATFAARALLLAEKERTLDERAVDRVVDLARLLAERLLGEELRLDPTRVTALARQALTEAQGARRIELAAHPEDAPFLEKELELAGADAVVRVVHDPTRARGNLRLDTELGSLDAELGPQLDRLVHKLRASLSHG
jgi:flagellar biosynthesis/type III secretory pathway protein FliH